MDQFPLTPMQQGMLFETIELRRPWTNLQQIVCRIDHALDADKLVAAWTAAQDRHPVLRSRFVWGGQETPTQIIEDDAPVLAHIEDWAGECEAEPLLTSWLASDRSSGIDLEQGPCHRLAIFRLGGGKAIVVWTFHHALLDGRSFTRVLEDVFDHYDDGRIAPPAHGEASFANHAKAVAERPHEPENQYFEQLLKGLQGPTELPIVRARPDGTPGPHETSEIRLSEQIADGLRRLGDDTGTTLYTCLLGAWSVLLGRYSRTSDVVFGSTRSGRHLIEHAANTAGCLINTVPTRVDVTSGQTVTQLLQSIRADQVDVRPFEQAALVESTASVPVTPGTTLLSTNVVFETYLMDTQLQSRSPAANARRFEVLEEGGFPLSLAGYEDNGLRLVLEYDPGRYPTDLAEAMLGHLGQLLSELAHSNPDTDIAELNMVTSDERDQLLHHPWFAPTAGSCYPDRFEDVVVRQPDADAVAAIGDERTLSYRQFDESANRLANHLISKGVGHGDRVAVCLRRGIEYAIAVIAIHKAQAAFVPLDPGYPPQALDHMIADSGARILVTESSVFEGLGLTLDGDVVGVVEIDTVDTSDTSNLSAAAPARPDLTPASLAYIIYTSGSTGVPKGVRIGHRQLTSHNAAFCRDFIDLAPDDRVLQFAALSFDTSIEELTPTWLAGSCVVMRDDEMAYSIPHFIDAVASQRLTVLNLPTAFWHELVRHLDERSVELPKTVRTTIIGGEKAAASAFRTWQRVAPDIPLINSYGPTECTVSATVQDPLNAIDPILTTELPIGRPLSNARAYVIDERHRPMPIGVAGELWIGGPCVGQGYHGLEELTAERFRPDPFHPADDARMYATGDLVRWLPTGDIEFLGRIDRQVKIRGYRIEPGQVEAAVESVPGVAQAVVAGRQLAGSDLQLVAWLRPEAAGAIDVASVFSQLRANLPPQMVPAAILVLDTFPIAAGGKVDMAALPDPEPAMTSSSPEGAAAEDRDARDELERSVQAVFEGVLGLDHVPMHGSFFNLGGHSLLAIRLLDSIEEKTGARITLPALHQAPTPALLASTVRDQSYHDAYRYLITIQAAQTDPAADTPPCLFGIHVLGINNEYFVPLAKRLGPTQTVYGLTLGRIGSTDLSTVPQIAAAYCAEIQRAEPSGPVVLAAVSLGSMVTLELAALLRDAGREVRLVALFDARGPAGSPAASKADRIRTHATQLVTKRTQYLVPRLAKEGKAFRERAQLARADWLVKKGRPLPEDLRMLRADRSHSHDQEAHVLVPYDGPVALFRADEELYDNPEWRRQGMGWSDTVTGPFHQIDVPGEHLSILAEPNVGALAEQLHRIVRTTTQSV